MDVLYELIWKDEFGMTCKFIWGGRGKGFNWKMLKLSFRDIINAPRTNLKMCCTIRSFQMFHSKQCWNILDYFFFQNEIFKINQLFNKRVSKSPRYCGINSFKWCTCPTSLGLTSSHPTIDRLHETIDHKNISLLYIHSSMQGYKISIPTHT